MNITAIGGGSKEPAMRAALETLPSEHTNVLVIPSACSTPASYGKKVPATLAFFAKLGVQTTVLHEFAEAPTRTGLQHELGSAALVYTIGGNSPHMLRLLSNKELGTELADALRRGKPHAGVSAGAALPFASIHSNVSARPSSEPWDFEQLNGLGVVRAVIGVHANKHDPTPNGPRPDSRLDHLLANFPPEHAYGVAIDEGAAVLLGPENRIVRADPAANVHLIFSQADGIRTHVVESPSELDVLVRA
jgi:peptidase E